MVKSSLTGLCLKTGTFSFWAQINTRFIYQEWTSILFHQWRLESGGRKKTLKLWYLEITISFLLSSLCFLSFPFYCKWELCVPALPRLWWEVGGRYCHRMSSQSPIKPNFSPGWCLLGNLSTPPGPTRQTLWQSLISKLCLPECPLSRDHSQDLNLK